MRKVVCTDLMSRIEKQSSPQLHDERRAPPWRRLHPSADQSPIFGLRSAVSFACDARHSLAVVDRDFPSPIRNQSSLPQRLQCFRHPRSAHAEVKADNTACQASQSPNLAFAELMRGERKHWRGGGRGAAKHPPRPFLLIPIPKPEGINSTNLSKVVSQTL